jgi:hypothetical protein
MMFYFLFFLFQTFALSEEGETQKKQESSDFGNPSNYEIERTKRYFDQTISNLKRQKEISEKYHREKLERAKKFEAEKASGEFENFQRELETEKQKENIKAQTIAANVADSAAQIKFQFEETQRKIALGTGIALKVLAQVDRVAPPMAKPFTTAAVNAFRVATTLAEQIAKAAALTSEMIAKASAEASKAAAVVAATKVTMQKTADFCTMVANEKERVEKVLYEIENASLRSSLAYEAALKIQENQKKRKLLELETISHLRAAKSNEEKKEIINQGMERLETFNKEAQESSQKTQDNYLSKIKTLTEIHEKDVQQKRQTASEQKTKQEEELKAFTKKANEDRERAEDDLEEQRITNAEKLEDEKEKTIFDDLQNRAKQAADKVIEDLKREAKMAAEGFAKEELPKAIFPEDKEIVLKKAASLAEAFAKSIANKTAQAAAEAAKSAADFAQKKAARVAKRQLQKAAREALRNAKKMAKEKAKSLAPSLNVTPDAQ